MTLIVKSVSIPAYSSLGYGEGETEDGRAVRFAGDHRSMQHLGEAINSGEEVEVEIEPWQVVG